MGMTDKQQEFYDKVYPLVGPASARTGIDPRLIYAQAALETGYGKSAPNNNLFGIKGKGGTQTTREFLNGQWVTIKDSFKGYSSFADSVAGYASFITGNKRYAGVAKAGDVNAQADAIQAAGYATDPNYASKLKAIIAGLPSGIGGGIGQSIGDVASSIGDAVSSGASTVASVASAPFDLLAKIFSAETAGRFVAVTAGLALIIIALIAFALTSDSGKQVISAVPKGI